MAAYKQAIGEGYTPRQAKNVLYNNVHFLDKRTIRRYMPNEAIDTEKIRTQNRLVDNDSENIKQNVTNSSIDDVQNSRVLREQNNLKKIGDYADGSAVSKKNGHKNPTETTLQLQDLIKQMNEYTSKLLEEVNELKNKSQNPKEGETKQSRKEETVSGKIYVDIVVPLVYREILHLKLNNISHGRILIDKGSYIKIEPRPQSSTNQLNKC